MKKVTARALEESIAHWDRLANNKARKEENVGAESCALCGRFNTGDEIDRLRAELAKFKEDAERYRWLRYPRMGWDIVRKTDGELLCAEYLDGIELDAAIDAARKGEEEGDGHAAR